MSKNLRRAASGAVCAGAITALCASPAFARQASTGCNGDVRQKATPGPLGYSERRDAGDPRCEGLYQRDVAADNLPEIAPISLVLRARAFAPGESTVITLAWPHVPARVELCARHAGNSIFYRMDAMEEPHAAPDRLQAACDEFRWDTGVLGRVAGQVPGFDLAHLRVLAQVNVPLVGETAERFPEPMRGKALLLPLLVNAPDLPQDFTPQDDAESANDNAAQSQAVRVALAFHTNRELRDVVMRCTPVTPGAAEPIVREISIAPRGIFTVRNLDLPATGGYWAVELVFRFHHEQDWEEDRSLFYVMAPNAECAQWGALPR